MHSSGFHGEAFGAIRRRALDYAVTVGTQNTVDTQSIGEPHGRNQTLHGEIPVSTGGLVVIFGTALAFTILLSALRYTLWGVVNTLAMVETPQTLIQLEAPPKPVDDNGQPIDVEVSAVKQHAITASIRNTIRHLHQAAGFRARWRGLALYICYNLAFSAITATVEGVLQFLPMFISAIISALVSALVLARWSTAWTHIVISEPSAKPWYRRVPGWKSWKNVWLPIVVNSLCERLTYLLPILTLHAFNMMPNFADNIDVKGKSVVLIIGQLLAAFGIGLVTFVALDLPSKVALVRVQASMLPEEDESIVPFDRSFGNKVVPAILGGTGAVSFIESWKTFNREARFRVLKLVVKMVAIEIALHLAFALLLGGELALFLKKNVKEHVKAALR